MHNVVGRIAWMTAAYLIGDDDGKKDLCGTLKKAGIPPNVAVQPLLADHSLYIGDHFLEARPDAHGVCNEDSIEDSEESEPYDLISVPSRQPLLALRAKTASASGSDADDSEDSDDLDLPVNKRSRMQVDSDSSEASEDEERDDEAEREQW